MHIKFLAHGTGSGVGAAIYLLGTHDSNGHERAEVRVLRGDPMLVGKLIDTLDFVQRYTSCVVAWSKNDNPTDEEIEDFINDFEKTAFPGLSGNQYAWSVVLHTEDDGSKHLHILVPRVELTSGKSLNIAPPKWQLRFDPLRDFWNHSHGWDRPDDPLRARLVQPGAMAPKYKRDQSNSVFNAAKVSTSDQVRQALSVEPDQRKVLTDWITSKVMDGSINSRSDVVDALASVGQINRQSDDTVSIRLNDGDKPIRLKGVIFNVLSDYKSIRLSDKNNNVLSDKKTKTLADKNSSVDRPKAAFAKIEQLAAIARLEKYNKTRYPLPKLKPLSDKNPSVVEQVKEVVPALILNKPTPFPTAQKEALETTNDGTRKPTIERIAEAIASTTNAIRSNVQAALATLKNNRNLVSAP